MMNFFLRNMQARSPTIAETGLLSNRRAVVRLVGYKKALDYDENFKIMLTTYGCDVEEEHTLEALPAQAEAMATRRRAVAEHCPAVRHHRQAGMITAFEVAPREGRSLPQGGRLGLALREAAMRRDVLLRPLHDTIYWMPALRIDQLSDFSKCFRISFFL